MDTVGPLQLSIFLIGSLAAAFVTGLAGFAFGLIAAAIWLYTLTPAQTTSLIVAYDMLYLCKDMLYGSCAIRSTHAVSCR
jgi:hypothetical protein